MFHSGDQTLQRAPLLLLLLSSNAALYAQSSNPTPSGPTVTAILRERTNATQWFAATPTDEVYGHQDSLLRLSLSQRILKFDYMVELGQTAEIALPTDAVSPVAAQGQLGLGGTYYASNGNNNNPAAASLRQAFLRYHFHNDATAFRLGRMEFFEGQELTPKDTTLKWVQTNRVAQRLIGNFGFANAQRSFDAVDFRVGGTNWDLTAMAGRSLQGVFNMNANPELNVDAQYLGYSRFLAKQHVIVRGFAIGYHDGRTGVTKTDNRSAAARVADHGNIRIGTYGGDMLATIPLRAVTFDVVLWGAGQNGRWGTLSHSAGAVTAEAGVRFNAVPSKPWIRGGWFRATGDNNPNDNKHNTFFQILPTPRVYARFPFFNQMNSTEQFVQIIDNPTKKLELRTDLHALQLTAKQDFWYQGGGAFDSKVFGYTGRPSNGAGSFASLYDFSADYAFTPQLSMTGYYARALGKTVVASIYPRDRNSSYGFFELNYRFQRKL